LSLDRSGDPACHAGIDAIWPSMRSLLALLVLLLGPVACVASASEQARTIVVPFVAGGSVDLAGRLVADALSEALRQRVTVENIGGGGGSLGAARVAKAPPDGTTLLLAAGYLPAQRRFHAALPYDPDRAFTPIGLVGVEPLILLARPGLPAPTEPAALASWLRETGQRLRIGHAGQGSSAQQCMLVLQHGLGIALRPVGFRGSAPALDLLGSESLDLTCEATNAALLAIREGKAKPLLVSGAARLAVLSTVPLLSEVTGQPEQGSRLMQWYGLAAPPDTPADVIAPIEQALQALLATPRFLDRLATLGTQPVPPAERGAAAMAARLAADARLIAEAAAEMGLRPH